MARPQKEGLTYFPHDVDASSDPKVEALQMIYGFEGYAFFFKILECLYRSPNCEIDISNAETKQETLQILAKKTAETREKFDKMLETALRHGCFNKEAFDNGILTSNGAKKRASAVIEKREYARKKYFNEHSTLKERNTNNINKSKVKESKVKDLPQSYQVNSTETLQKPQNTHKTETLEEYTERILKPLFPKLDIKLQREKFDTYWSESGRKLHNPKTAFRNWLEREEKYKKEHNNGKKPADNTDPDYFKKGKYGHVVES